jgi:hypothetical protein
MNTGRRPALAPNLDRVCREFDVWRRRRRGRSPIPPRLWALAVEHARVAGVHCTARRLRLNYYSLKQRVESVGAVRALDAPPGPAFVEVVTSPRPPAGASECVLELADARGATLRIVLKGAGLPDLATLSQLFWGARR